MSTGSWTPARRLPTIPRLLPRRLRSVHTVLLALAIVLVGWLGWTWYRGSSFVKVEHVTVTGLSGPDVSQIRGALTRAALGMTTLDMQISKLEATVQSHDYVRSITVSHHGAHSVVIHVTEQVPVALVQAGGETQVADGSGQILPITFPHGELPEVPLRSAPDGRRVTGHGARAALSVLAAAPYALLAHLQSATSSAQHGVIVQLRDGPQLYFGPADELAQKWRAVVAVLQNSDSAGADYIDVTDPSRPAAGVGVSTKQAGALGLVATASAATSQASTSATDTTAQP